MTLSPWAQHISNHFYSHKNTARIYRFGLYLYKQGIRLYLSYGISVSKLIPYSPIPPLQWSFVRHHCSFVGVVESYLGCVKTNVPLGGKFPVINIFPCGGRAHFPIILVIIFWYLYTLLQGIIKYVIINFINYI